MVDKCQLTFIDIKYYDTYMDFITRKEAAKYFRVAERTIDRWIEKGILKAYKMGESRTASLRIPKAEIKRFLNKYKK